MVGSAEAAEDRHDTRSARMSRRCKVNRGALPAHLPGIERVIDVADTTSPCCVGAMHKIGDDIAERLDMIPPGSASWSPGGALSYLSGKQRPDAGPGSSGRGGLPTEALVAHGIVAKYADHLPLYRQAQIYARQGIALDRSTLADWVGRAA